MFKANTQSELLSSKLYNQDTFYKAFIYDLKAARHEVIIESPFITIKRINALIPAIQNLLNKGVRIIINTKPINEHEPYLQRRAELAIARLQQLGILVLVTGGHHRKLAI